MSISETSHTRVTSDRVAFGIAVLGGPTTTIVDVAGHRLICDPTFDPPADYGYLQKTVGPAVDESSVGDVDAALVSHDLHPDNLRRRRTRLRPEGTRRPDTSDRGGAARRASDSTRPVVDLDE